ncbi:hypothetical protein FZC78_10445 [Rossellomorea vietnamensis]|uniref:Uncharacterized protein n=1 Tax=Rossellomorea vietnamensis TaxID=218284 RepID=A0A5D4NS78_9BACI|nr:hypothetical protein [Rossellomorea vietnamensis]TYS17037.1 hypothetical protein FZC78_10445 [Rossellomorea vietnamensis]
MNQYKTKIKKFLSFLLIAGISAGLSYLIVYKVSFLPNGYEFTAVQENHVSLQSFNWLGMEKVITTLSFSEEDAWMVDAMLYEVDRQKEFLWLLYTAVTVSLILLLYKIRKGMKPWKAILESNIIFAVGIPLYTLVTSWNRIEKLADLVA